MRYQILGLIVTCICIATALLTSIYQQNTNNVIFTSALMITAAIMLSE